MPSKLNVGKTIFGAFIIPWQGRHAFVRTLWSPVLALTLVSLPWAHLDDPLRGRVVWILYAAFWLIFVLFAVTCHRLVLLDAAADSFRVLPSWSRRETRFALLLLAVGFLSVLAMLVASAVLMNLPWVRTASGDRFQWIIYFALIPAYYVFARLSLVLPATAVDKVANLKWAWQRTKKNGWRLVVVVGVLPWAVSEAVALLYRSSPTIIETLLFGLLSSLLTIVEVAALSLSYRELTMNEVA